MTNVRRDPTRSEIRRAALDLFATEGYDAASIRIIADRVGIRGPSMYSHYSSKEEILWELTRDALHELRDTWETQEDTLRTAEPNDRLDAFVRVHVTFHAQRHHEAALINAQLHRLSPDHYRTAVRLRSEYEAIAIELVRQCLLTGRHDVPDLRVTVFAILQMGVAVSTWYRPEGPMSLEQLCDVYVQLAAKLLAPENRRS